MTQRIPRIAHAHAPSGTAIVRHERMSPAFIKYHLDDGRALHRFTRPEPHACPHDHPWPFRTEILSGGYVEEVFIVLSNGRWTSTLIGRLPGSTYEISAAHIHRIVALPADECWTLVSAGVNNAAYCRQQAEIERGNAEATSLVNVRERSARAAESWDAMAGRAELTERSRRSKTDDPVASSR